MQTGFIIAHDGSLVSLDAVDMITYSSGQPLRPLPDHLKSAFSPPPPQAGHYLHMHTGTKEPWVIYAGTKLRVKSIRDLVPTAAEMAKATQGAADV